VKKGRFCGADDCPHRPPLFFPCGCSLLLSLQSLHSASFPSRARADLRAHVHMTTKTTKTTKIPKTSETSETTETDETDKTIEKTGWHNLPTDIGVKIINLAGTIPEWMTWCLAFNYVGLLAKRSEEKLKWRMDPMFKLATQLLLHSDKMTSSKEEALLREYALHPGADSKHFDWITEHAHALGLTTLNEMSSNRGIGQHWRTPEPIENWYLTYNGVKVATLRQYNYDYWYEEFQEPYNQVCNPERKYRYYDGMLGQKRLRVMSNGLPCQQREDGSFIQVRLEFAGERGEERIVRDYTSNGGFFEMEGEWGQERRVRFYSSIGNIWHFEGEKNREKLFRVDYADGKVGYYEGAHGEERLARKVHKSGVVYFYEGEGGQERVVRKELHV